MSCTIAIAPSAPLPTWGSIRRALRDTQPTLVQWGHEEALKDDTLLPLDRYCDVRGEDGTRFKLSLGTLPNDPSITTPEEWFGEWGRVPDREVRTAAWHRAGYYFLLDSMPGGPEGDLEIMADLAAALAEVTQGVLMLQDGDCFGVSNGVHTAEEFRAARSA